MRNSDESKVYLVDTAFAVFACSEDGSIIDYEKLPTEVDEAASKLLSLERGELIEEMEKLCGKMASKGVKLFIVEDESLATALREKLGVQVSVEQANPAARKIRAQLEELVVKLQLRSSTVEAHDFIYSVSMAMTRRKLREAAEKRDLLVAQAVNAIDDLNKSINLLVSRLREWYSVHFPELNDMVRDHEVYVKLVSSIGLRGNYTAEALTKLDMPKGKAKKIARAAENSIGADIAEFDVKPMMALSAIIEKMYELRGLIEDYIDQTMDEVAPNIKGLVGSLIGARLIALAGGLDELAKLPASTIQVLGAEKALFRALRTGAKPPKHGVIFQCPEVHRAPRWQRGKIARALAGKLAIAARVDAFTGTYIVDELKEDLKKRIEEIKRIYAKPPKRAEVRVSRRRRRKRR